MPRPWVFIDTPFLCHRVRHTMGKLSYDDLPTGVIYGFFESLLTLCFDKRILSNRVACFFDSKHSYRRDKFADYKCKRLKARKTDDEWREIGVMKQQVKRLWKEILPTIGIPCYRQHGLESDDVMAQAAREASDDCQPAVIVTADEDLLQCLDVRVSWFSPTKNKMTTALSFFHEYGIPPEEWANVKRYAGCDTDDVPGVPGVGEATAIKFLTDKLPKHHKSYHAIIGTNGQEIYRRNRDLVCLPHPRIAPVRLTEPRYDPAAFFRLCEKLGMQSYLKGRRWMWDAFFSGKMDSPVQSRIKPRRRNERSAR